MHALGSEAVWLEATGERGDFGDAKRCAWGEHVDLRFPTALHGSSAIIVMEIATIEHFNEAIVFMKISVCKCKTYLDLCHLTICLFVPSLLCLRVLL